MQNDVCISFTVTLACMHQTIRGEGFELSENLAVCFKTEIGPARIPTDDICLTLKSLNGNRSVIMKWHFEYYVIVISESLYSAS